MDASLRHQRARLDRALLTLLEERARLVRLGEHVGAADVTDLLDRARGPIAAEDLRDLMTIVDRACRRRNAS